MRLRSVFWNCEHHFRRSLLSPAPSIRPPERGRESTPSYAPLDGERCRISDHREGPMFLGDKSEGWSAVCSSRGMASIILPRHRVKMPPAAPDLRLSCWGLRGDAQKTAPQAPLPKTLGGWSRAYSPPLMQSQRKSIPYRLGDGHKPPSVLTREAKPGSVWRFDVDLPDSRHPDIPITPHIRTQVLVSPRTCNVVAVSEGLPYAPPEEA